LTKEVRAKIITAALGVALVGFAVAQRGGWNPSETAGGSILRSAPAKEPTPQDAIYRMLDAAKDGDVEEYLACFQGETARRIAQSRDEMGQAEFAQYLSRRNAEVKGFAIYEAEPGADETKVVTVEYVYEDRKEAQNFHLAKTADGWIIDRMDAASRMEVAVPYGTPVY